MEHGQINLEEARRVPLKINTNKTKVLTLRGYRTISIRVIGQNIDRIQQFVYQWSVIFVEGSTEPDAVWFINNVKLAFVQFRKCSDPNTTVKLKPFYANAVVFRLDANKDEKRYGGHAIQVHETPLKLLVALPLPEI